MRKDSTSTENIKKPVQRRRIMKPMDVGRNAESQFKTYADKEKEHEKAKELLERLKQKEKEQRALVKAGKVTIVKTELLNGCKTSYKKAA